MFEFAVIVAIITGLVQVVKQAEVVPNKAMPIVSIVLGMAAGYFFVEGAVDERIFIGIAMGLAASGLFDVAKLPKRK
jgi:hypothetical protein